MFKNIIHNKFIHKLYHIVWYDELGNGIASRIYAPVALLASIVTFFMVNFNIRFSIQMVLLWSANLVIFLFILGYTYKKTKLYDIERSVQSIKDPITNEILTLLRKIDSNEKQNKT